MLELLYDPYIDIRKGDVWKAKTSESKLLKTIDMSAHYTNLETGPLQHSYINTIKGNLVYNDVYS